MQLSPLLKLESARAKLPFSKVPRYGPARANELVEGDGEALGRAGPVVRVGLGLGVGDAVAVGEVDGRGVEVDVGVGDAVAVGEGDGRGVEVDVGVGDAVAVGEGVGRGEAVCVGEGDGEAVGVGVGVATGRTAGEPSPGQVCESLISEFELRIFANVPA